MITKEELLSLFDDYNDGNYSFAEVLLASGRTISQLVAFMRENGIEIQLNLDFMDKGKGLDEDALERILEMNKDE